METQAQVIDNAAMLESVAAWSLGVRDRMKAWLWFAGFAILVGAVAAYAKVNPAWAIAVIVASVYFFAWWLRRTTRREWQRYYFAGLHFQALLESRKALQSMSKEERAEVKPEVAKFLLSMFIPSGICDQGVLWEDAEAGVLYPATRRMKLDIMGLSKQDDKKSPRYKEVEYAWDRYGEIDPEREWIRKLRVRGGYVESPEKFRAALEENQRRWNTKQPDGTKENA